MNGVAPGRFLRAFASGADQNKNSVGDSDDSSTTRLLLLVPFGPPVSQEVPHPRVDAGRDPPVLRGGLSGDGG